MWRLVSGVHLDTLRFTWLIHSFGRFTLGAWEHTAAGPLELILF